MLYLAMVEKSRRVLDIRYKLRRQYLKRMGIDISTTEVIEVFAKLKICTWPWTRLLRTETLQNSKKCALLPCKPKVIDKKYLQGGDIVT